MTDFKDSNGLKYRIDQKISGFKKIFYFILFYHRRGPSDFQNSNGFRYSRDNPVGRIFGIIRIEI